jgi:hypothetical protein
MNLKDKMFIVYCPSCNNIHSIEDSLDNAYNTKWKHFWKSKEGHVREDDIKVMEYRRY